jgi:hypothetical protein
MLASITPLGERSRGFSWRLTFSAFASGAVLAGAVVGAAGGAIGSLLPGGSWRAVVALAALGVAVAYDAGSLGSRLPSSRRQVNEDWMTRYRGWVYGLAFGAQLGVGLATVVTSAAIYVTALATVIVGSIAGGALIGAVFGAARAASLIPARSARDPSGLMRVQRRLDRLAAPARRLVVAAELVAIILIAGSLA